MPWVLLRKTAKNAWCREAKRCRKVHFPSGKPNKKCKKQLFSAKNQKKYGYPGCSFNWVIVLFGLNYEIAKGGSFNW